MSSTCPHNMVNFGPLAAEICWRVWGTPANFKRVSRLGSVTAATSLSGGQPNFARCLAVSCASCYTIYISGGSCPLTEFCPVQNSLYVQVLRSLVLPALLHGTSASGVSQTLRRGTRNGITELPYRAPPIFGRAAITLGIGPHSSSFFFSSPNLSGRRLDVYHTSTHGVALCEFRMQVRNVVHAARWKHRTQKIAILAPSHNFVGLYLRN